LKGKKNAAVLESPDLVAFVQLTQNLTPCPTIREHDRRVVFVFDEDIRDSIGLFYKNVPVPILDYCKNLKSVRSAIHNLRQGGTFEK
jgi:hypothetical protein